MRLARRRSRELECRSRRHGNRDVQASTLTCRIIKTSSETHSSTEGAREDLANPQRRCGLWRKVARLAIGPKRNGKFLYCPAQPNAIHPSQLILHDHPRAPPILDEASRQPLPYRP
jgi:hypothetical protein